MSRAGSAWLWGNSGEPVRETVQEVRDSFLQLPLIVRCMVAGAVSGTVILEVIVVGNVISDYPLRDVAQAAVFGAFEAGVAGVIAGCCLGLVVGLAAYLLRGGMRAVTRLRS